MSKSQSIIDAAVNGNYSHKIISTTDKLREKNLILDNYYPIWKNDKTFINQFKKSNVTIIKHEKEDPKVLVEPFIYIPSMDDDPVSRFLSITQEDIKEINDKTGITDITNPLHNSCELTKYQQINLETAPLVKIIYSQDEQFKVGDICIVPDSLAIIEYNKDYVEWWDKRAGNPTLEKTVKMPSEKLIGWEKWIQFTYYINKFDNQFARTFKDTHIYLIPASFIRGFYTK